MSTQPIVFSDEEQEFLSSGSSSFRFNAQTVFLTYPHASFDLLLLISFINSKLPTGNVVAEWIACRELHADGDPHVHACIRFREKINVRDATRYFDFCGFHPNFRSVRRWNNAVKYCKKDGDFLSAGLTDRGEKRSLHDVYTDAEHATSAEEAMQIITEGAPRDAWIFHDKLEAKVAKKFPKKSKPYVSRYTKESFTNVPPVAREWAERYLAELPADDRCPTLLLLGPSRIGKTAWARSLGPHIYMNGYYNLEKIKMCHAHDFVILDDIKWPNLQAILKGIIGCQEEFELTDKYMKKHTIANWFKPCILLWNPDYFPKERDLDEIRWWDENVLRVDCREKFF